MIRSHHRKHPAMKINKLQYAQLDQFQILSEKARPNRLYTV